MSDYRLAVALASYEGASATELTVAEQEELWLLAEQPEEAQRNGWVAVVRCADGPRGEPGLLPADYVALVDARVSLMSDAEDDDAELATSTKRSSCYFNESDGVLAGWLAEATLVLADADEGAALEAVALADFEPMSDVELPLVAGEKLAVLLGSSERAAPPDGWAVALQHESRDSSGRAAKGLVPATFVKLLPFEATVLTATSQPPADPYSPDAPVAMVRDRRSGELVMPPAVAAAEQDAARDERPKEPAVTKGERVRVLPELSTAECWWVQRYQMKRRLSLAYDKRVVGGAEGLSGEEGLVNKARLQPISAASLEEGLQREAQAVRHEGAAVLTMHRYVRGWVTRRKLLMAKRNGASRKITHAVRGYHERQSFVAQRAAALFIERCWRGVLARRRAQNTRRQMRWEADTEKARVRAAFRRAEREAHQTASVVAAAMAARVVTGGVEAAANVEDERARRRAEAAAAEAARLAAEAEEEQRLREERAAQARAAMTEEARAALEAREAAEATLVAMRRDSLRSAELAEQRRLAAERRRQRDEERRRSAAAALVASEAESVVAAALETATVAAATDPSEALMAAVLVSVAARMVDEATAAALEAAVAAAVMTAAEAAKAAERAEALRARAAAHRAAVAAAEAAAAAEEERRVAEAAAKAKARAMARAKALADRQEAAARALQEAEAAAAAQEAAAASAQLARERAAARLLEAQQGAGARFAAISRELELTRTILAEQRRSIALSFAQRDRGWVRMRRLRLMQSDAHAEAAQDKRWSQTISDAMAHRDATLPQEQGGGGKGGKPPPTMKDLDEQAADEQLAYATAAAAAVAGHHHPPPGQRAASSSPRSWRLGRSARHGARTQPSTTDAAASPDDGGAVTEQSPDGTLGTLSIRNMSGTRDAWVVETYLTPAPPPRRVGLASPRAAHAMPPLWFPQRVSDVIGRGGMFDSFGFAAASRHLRPW